MLLDQYKIRSRDGQDADHYEYVVDLKQEPRDCAVSPARMIEAYVSGILGRQVEFFRFGECRFFAEEGLMGRSDLTVDLSVTESGEECWSVTVDITDKSGVLVELSGKLAPVVPAPRAASGKTKETSVAPMECSVTTKRVPVIFKRLSCLL